MMEAVKLVFFVLVGCAAGSWFGESPCEKEQREAFEFMGENGFAVFTPVCEKKGDYKAVQCQNKECRCVTRGGEHIEGYDQPYKTSRSRNVPENKQMNCNCARDFHEYREKKLIGKLFHCLDNGNYHPVQCQGSVCFCADAHGKQSSNAQSVPITEKDSLKC